MFDVIDLGLIAYPKACQKQQEAVKFVAAGAGDCLFLCEHPEVLTLGRTARAGSLLVSKEAMAKRGVDVFSADRGGDVTLHAPGQLVAYPVFDLKRTQKDIRLYLRKLERSAVDLLREFGIVAEGRDNPRGIWVDQRKIASMGIGIRKWVAFHGLALNVTTDLSLFAMIRPCGLDVEMTSMEEVLGRAVGMDEVKKRLVKNFEKHFKEQETIDKGQNFN